MSEPIIEYREEFNVTDIVRKYAERVACVIDEQTLANVEDQLARYGYVKVVRCIDCRFSIAHGNGCGRNQDFYDVEPYGFCKWAERKEDGNE